ncbi:phytase [Sphingomonas psychrotolerans]|uniref:Phytase n=1 Tax=Sphingomonas psychrotolerans TaxID=1327635 RepID=A0A2K8MRN6_9SPHN|nr:phytase [Sphingomonas psychrotolerans]ATY34689.1 phytase [Sphingomonas psychrotolerans]
MRGKLGYNFVTAAFLLAGCTPATAPQPVAAPTVASAPTVEVPASGETVAVATQLADAADDPAIWTRAGGLDFAGKHQDGIILGTDKKAGLYVFGLDGQSLQFLPEGLLNNVDLRGDGDGFIAGASDRGRMGVALYRFTGAGQLTPAGFIKSDVIEPYGFCMGRLDGTLIAVLIAKDGAVREYALATGPDGLSGTERRRYAVGSQSEGCTIDDATGTLYIGEELKGVWRYPLRSAAGTRTLVADIGDGRLIADVEGTTLIHDGGRTLLLVSSQGDSAFAVWDVSGASGAERYIGRFRVAAAGGVDAVTGTDGLDAWTGAIGPYRSGLVVVQDDVNEGGAQNFKLVDWAPIRVALGL